MNITELLKTESIYSSDDIVEKIQTYYATQLSAKSDPGFHFFSLLSEQELPEYTFQTENVSVQNPVS